MAPIRRYLRISPHSVLEVRFYLEDPYSEGWLLDPRNAVLSRVITVVKPHVFRQLREEKERARGKSKKKKGLKDIAIEEDFEVSVFLTDGGTQHNLLVKQKQFGGPRKKLKSNSSKLTGWLAGSRERPMELDDDDDVEIRQESDDESTDMSKSHAVHAIPDDFSDDEGFVQTQALAPEQGDEGAEGDDKKKLAMNLSYDGFGIYSKVLCLVVKRRKGRGGGDAAGGRQMLESWVSTQAQEEPAMLED